MKTLIKRLLRIINTFLYNLIVRNMTSKNSSFYFVKLHIENTNSADFIKTDISDSHIVETGTNNVILADHASISNSIISISGTNNKLILEPEVNLRSATIHIRGSNCTIKIGRGTSFGAIRIVNAGSNNNIVIGEYCAFSDFIELWASDTHSIYDSEGKFINPERPIVIGDKVWVGSHVKILKGVTIGSGAIIGMNTVVTKDVAPKTLNIGNPMRCIKEDISWSLNYENE